MGGSKVTDSTILYDVISIPELEDNIHPLCTDARDEVVLHDNMFAILIGQLYSDLHDCTLLFRHTVDAARLSDPYDEVPLPTNKDELKTEFDGMMAAYNLYNNKEVKLRKRCTEKVKEIEMILENMTTMTLDECVHLYGFDLHVLTDYVLPKLIFITKLVFRFRGMSDTLLFCYQKRLGLIKDEKDKETPLDAESIIMNDDGIYDGDSLKYDAMKEFDEWIADDEDTCGSDADDELGFDEQLTISLSEAGMNEKQIKTSFKIEQQLPLYYCAQALKSLGIFIASQIGIETVSYLASAFTGLFHKLF